LVESVVGEAHDEDILIGERVQSLSKERADE
jgi:hypothetical protein